MGSTSLAGPAEFINTRITSTPIDSAILPEIDISALSKGREDLIRSTVAPPLDPPKQPPELTSDEKLKRHALNPDFNSARFRAYRAKYP